MNTYYDSNLKKKDYYYSEKTLVKILNLTKLIFQIQDL